MRPPAPPPSRREVLDRLRSFASNSNAFLMVYGGFRFHRPSGGKSLIGFLETPTTWVAAAEPLGHDSTWEDAWRDFAGKARAQGKSTVVLPVGERGLQAAERAGYGSLMIGAEPKFDLSTYRPSSDTVHSARLLSDKGATVREFRPAESEELRRECESITEEWLRNRPLAPLDFLNRVAPWEAEEHKRYFLVGHGGRILAFLAAVPTFASRGWYFIDILRRSRSPAGSTELLVLEAMRQLKADGAAEISLGVSPLSQLERANRKRHPFLYPVLSFVFRRSRLFYRFKPLYEFKLKFRPSRWEPAYLVYSPATLKPSAALGLIQTMVGAGLIASVVSLFPRLWRRFDFERWIQARLSGLFLCRSLPSSATEALQRSLGTVCLILLVLIFPSTAGAHSKLDKLLPLTMCGTLLEWLGGTELVLLCFLVPAGILASLWAGVAAVSGGLALFFQPLSGLVVAGFVATAYSTSSSSWRSLEKFGLAWVVGFLCAAVALGRHRSILRRQPF